MCLARAYIANASVSTANPGNEAGELVADNVTKLVVANNRIVLTSLLGGTTELHAHLQSIDFAESKIFLQEVAP